MSESIFACPHCGTEGTAVIETRRRMAGSFETKMRRLKCRSCGKTHKTAEVPWEIAVEVFGEDG